MAHTSSNTIPLMKYEIGEKLRLRVSCEVREKDNRQVIHTLAQNTIVEVSEVKTINRRDTLDSSDADGDQWMYKFETVVECDVLAPGGIVIKTDRYSHAVLAPQKTGQPKNVFYKLKEKVYLLQDLKVEYIQNREKSKMTLTAGTPVFTSKAMTKKTGSTIVHNLQQAYYEIDLGAIKKVQVEVQSREWRIFKDLERLST